jgi:hypothetical protein
VVRAFAASRLDVEVDPDADSTSAAASVRVEPLSQGLRAREPETSFSPSDVALFSSDFSIVGHVADIGDIRTASGEWLAGPNAPSRIEGVLIDWPSKPTNLEILYSVTTARPNPLSKRMVKIGEYAGTRGKALALVGLAIEMGGAPTGVQLSAEAIFLGSPSIRRRGQRIVLAGPTGREPLVGLKFAIEHSAPVSDATAPQRTAPPPTNMGRVRVFRARAKPQQEADDPSRKFARPA